ncbi:MAG: valine--tRNA ligase [Candidatus Omnitrophota bacterium]
MPEMSTRFNFGNVEKKWRRYWEDNHIFHAEPTDDKDPYAVVIPPPNVTGILHMGHALNDTLQDILIRYKRLRGFETCWMPGTDHAGIATQNVVEKQLAKENLTRHDIGRKKMLERLWSWKQQYGDTIINQLKTIGASCDWDRTRFTMDDHYSRAVRHVFVALYKKGLIYRGKYIINWCPRCQTALSDEEAEHQEHQGALYHIRYPFKDNPQQFLTVATTRPETMLGDTAVAVHPDDDRYRSLVGKTLILPIINREIPIITDDFVDPDFGSGAVKVTPAHDPNDFAMGQRHNLPMINIMHADGRLNEQAGSEFNGMDRFEAREAIIEVLKQLKVLDHMDEHTHAVGHCYRCHTVIEPYLSRQWFVKMAPLAEPALRVVQEGKVRFHPQRWAKVYCNWLENIRDWCISRQIWWGHRIPVWYCRDCDAVIVRLDDPDECPECGSKDLRQDEDVLDTWFSSWLWPFATFGWPEESRDVNYFYPTDSLFTASEIIFFWVARMVMAGIEFLDDIPFSDVLIHGTVRDTRGRKMSKSLGNALDPLEIVDEYGADALRFSLIMNSGQDIYISKEKFEIGRNFANKIWNASRLVLMNLSVEKRHYDLSRDIDLKNADLAARWIVSRFTRTLSGVGQAIEQFRYSEAESLIYDFFWGEFCDWYLEIIKTKMDNQDVQKATFAILEQSIRMMHPFVPFVTEEIWQHFALSADCLSRCTWPEGNTQFIDEEAEDHMALIMEFVTAVRNLKAQWNIPPQQSIECILTSKNTKTTELIQSAADMISPLTRIDSLSLQDVNAVENAAAGVVRDIKFFIPLGDIVDIKKERARMEDDLAVLKKNMASVEKRLQNEAFLGKAPQEVIEKDRGRLTDMQKKHSALQDVLAHIH